jgi:polyisoprenoid-binding protein YceI
MKFKLFIVSIAFIFPFLVQAQEMTINLSGVKITFVADMQKTEGSVSGLKAKINFNLEDLAKSEITGTVDVKTLNTGNDQRDEHLKSADFFDAAKYPTMSFKSTSFEKVEGKFSFENKVFKGTSTIQAANYDLGSFAKKEAGKTNVKISFTIPVN